MHITRLATYPQKIQAVLFYSQTGTGKMDHMSRHGGCPVISGTKWGANLWVWNGPVYKSPAEKKTGAPVTLTFVNKGTDVVELFWEEISLAVLHPEQTYGTNTYYNHQVPIGAAIRLMLRCPIG